MVSNAWKTYGLLIALALSSVAQASAHSPLEAGPVSPFKDELASTTVRLAFAREADFCMLASRQDLACRESVEQVCSGPLHLGSALLGAYAQHRTELEQGRCPQPVLDALQAALSLQQAFAQHCQYASQLLSKQEPLCAASDPSLKTWSAEKSQVELLCRGERRIDPALIDELRADLQELESSTTCQSVLAVFEAATPASFSPGARTVPNGRTGEAPAGPTDLESMVINGLTSFVLERARQEFIDFSLDQLSQGICKNTKPQGETLKALFPALCAHVKASDDARIALVPGQMFRQAILQDLHALPGNLSTIVVKAPFEHHELAACGLELGQLIFEGTTRHEPALPLVLAAVDRIGESLICRKAFSFPGASGTAWPTHAEAVRSAFRLIAAEWLHASADQRREYLQDPAKLVSVLLPKVPSSVPGADALKLAMERLVPAIIRVQAALSGLTSAMGEAEKRLPLVRELLSASIETLENTFDLMLLLQPKQPGQEPSKARTVAVGVLRGTRQLLEGSFAAGLTTLLTAVSLPTTQEPYVSLVRFGGLLTEIGSARSSDEVAAALESAAAPAGSWRLRRKKWTLGLSARVGVAAGMENVLGESPDGKTSRVPWGATTGLSLPVGLDASIPLGENWALGVMLHPIDLGAVATARLGGTAQVMEGEVSERATLEPKVGFAQVLALGGPAPGQHASLMGADGPGKQEIAVEELARVRVFSDEWEQASHGGDIAHAVEAGVLERADVTELGAVLAGAAEGRRSADEATVFDSTGLAIQDLAIALAALERVDELELPHFSL